MKRQERKAISANIRYELREGTHTYTMCQCGRRGCRSLKCWECWLHDLVEGKTLPVEVQKR